MESNEVAGNNGERGGDGGTGTQAASDPAGEGDEGEADTSDSTDAKSRDCNGGAATEGINSMSSERLVEQSDEASALQPALAVQPAPTAEAPQPGEVPAPRSAPKADAALRTQPVRDEDKAPPSEGDDDEPQCCRCVAPGVLAPLATPRPGFQYSDPSTCAGAELRRSYATGRCYWPRDPATCATWPHALFGLPPGWAEDYGWYLRNYHPLLSLFLADDAHTLSMRKRWQIEAIVIVTVANVSFTGGGLGVTGDWGFGSTLFWTVVLMMFRNVLLMLAVCPCVRFNEKLAHEDDDDDDDDADDIEAAEDPKDVDSNDAASERKEKSRTGGGVYRNSACCCCPEGGTRQGAVELTDWLGDAALSLLIVLTLCVFIVMVFLQLFEDGGSLQGVWDWWLDIILGALVLGQLISLVLPTLTTFSLLTPSWACCCSFLVGKWNRERALYQAQCRKFMRPRFEPVHLQGNGCCICGCCETTGSFEQPDGDDDDDNDTERAVCQDDEPPLAQCRLCEWRHDAGIVFQCICFPECARCCVPASQGGSRRGIVNIVRRSNFGSSSRGAEGAEGTESKTAGLNQHLIATSPEGELLETSSGAGVV